MTKEELINELHQRIAELERSGTEHRQMKDKIDRAYHIQHAINSILQTSMEDISLKEQLERSLDLIFSVPWFALHPIGCIYLVEDDPDVLVMKSQRGFSEAHQAAFAELPFGQCLCGRAASTRKILFADRVDERHEICHEGMLGHGHYCVPILSCDKLLGVMCLYVMEGHKRDRDEEEFLYAVSNTLAGIIERKQTELEKQSLQVQLIQSEKMSAVGTLVAGVAHEMNNPMMGIMNYAQYCIKKTPEDHDIYPILQKIEHETNRCVKIIENLLTFSHMEKEGIDAYQRGSLSEILDRVLQLLSYRVDKEKILITQNIDEGTPEVWMNINNIQQVFLNLINNAMDAVRNSRKKEILVDIHHRDIYVQARVADSGPGITPENLQRIFDPFFTTKPAGQGTGLGLSISHSIIKAHGGEISCESKVGKGTTFKILLPIEKVR